MIMQRPKSCDRMSIYNEITMIVWRGRSAEFGNSLKRADDNGSIRHFVVVTAS